MRRLIQDSLRYWVTEMHVDGFRFDLASILSRDEAGHPLPSPPILWDIESDPLLAGTKLIAEAWDAAGLYQVGSFGGDAWHEWNGKFRDDVRAFLKGDEGTVRRVAARLIGSPDIFGHEEREAEQSINFVTCHDGFTLNDLVSYDRKHNEANGEDNRDGANDNLSWNCGVEGPTDDAGIEALRNRQAKNFLVLNLMAVGTPMLLMGDEVRRTQQGNNNAYCQDSAAQLVRLGSGGAPPRHPAIRQGAERRFASGVALVDDAAVADVERAARPREAAVARRGSCIEPDWNDNSHSLAFTIQSRRGRHPVPRHSERLLGAAHLRAPASGRRPPVAPVHRHGAGRSPRHPAAGRGADRGGGRYRRAAALRRRARANRRRGRFS